MPVGWEAQHDLASMCSIQEQAVPSSGNHNNMVTALPLSSQGQTCTQNALYARPQSAAEIANCIPLPTATLMWYVSRGRRSDFVLCKRKLK